MFDIYIYDADNGELFGIEHSIDESCWKEFANEMHGEGWLIKVVDQADGAVVYTLG